jgi:hypothetical protein
MGEFLGIVISVLCLGAAFVLGFSLRQIVNFYRERRDRERRNLDFWAREMGNGETVIFLGPFSSNVFAGIIPRNTDFEPSGLMGLGDARALHELTAHLSKHGIKVDLVYTPTIS